MDKFIYTNELSISKGLCKDIIYLFESDNSKYQGVTQGGVDKSIKDTNDLLISPENPKWKRIYNFLELELSRNIKIYLDSLQKYAPGSKSILYSNMVTTQVFMIQRYIKGIGKYIYHNDSQIEWSEKKYRVITYLWYLNDIDEGGETEFWGGDYSIKPRAGKLLLFPALWTYPHSGKHPISDNKYIITGWLYINTQ